MQQQDNHEYPFLYQRQTCHQVQPNQDRKSGSAGMPRPISYAVFCLKKKNVETDVLMRSRGFDLAACSEPVTLASLALAATGEHPGLRTTSCVSAANGFYLS